MEQTLLREQKPDQLESFNFSFEHQGKQFQVEIDPESVFAEGDGMILTFQLKNDGQEFARIMGLIQPEGEGLKFTVKMANNFTNPEAEDFNPELPTAPGLVRHFIMEVQTKQLITTWVSDTGRSEAANRMYEQLAEVPGFHVNLLPQGANSFNPLKPAYVVWKDADNADSQAA